ncbi:MAG: hypothetical protein JXX28_04270 [Deltaproteobacteria bacterium]|nr:hypothetical protein [Deltaproteobacteria bacterium]
MVSFEAPIQSMVASPRFSKKRWYASMYSGSSRHHQGVKVGCTALTAQLKEKSALPLGWSSSRGEREEPNQGTPPLYPRRHGPDEAGPPSSAAPPANREFPTQRGPPRSPRAGL